MIMPFIRLITIYVLVGVAVFVIFNRDGVKQMLGIAGDSGAVAYSDPSLPPIPPSAPSGDATAAATPVDTGGTTPPDDMATATVAQPATQTTTPAQPVAAEAIPAPVPATPTPTEAATPAPAAPVQQADVTQRLNAARAAYWKGDSAGAETLYKALIADFPDRVDFAGELGNIYYSSGRTALAAPYYKVVARDLLARGKTAEAQAMLSVLQAIAPKMANDLRAHASQTN